MSAAIPAFEIPTVPIHGSADRFPVRHIYCVGRNYAEHAKEMGGDASKEPPFFFTKAADSVVPVVPPAPMLIIVPLVIVTDQVPVTATEDHGEGVNVEASEAECSRCREVTPNPCAAGDPQQLRFACCCGRLSTVVGRQEQATDAADQ
jgi:hypothetical protein